MLAIEGAVTLLGLALAYCLPQFGASLGIAVIRRARAAAERPALATSIVGVVAFVLRLVTLPLNPIPHPFILDAFSYLLAGDTFAAGRVTNPTPPMWTHFETFQVTMKPTYMSMYFPAHGLVLALGKVLFGSPWWGLLCACSVMCAMVCWALQGWLPLTWAFLAGLLAVLRLGLFSYWINTYSGGAAIAAIGGALVFGSVPRILRRPRAGVLTIFTIGLIILANSRPYEGILLCIPAAFVLLRAMFAQKIEVPARVLIARLSLPVALIVLAGSGMAYYNHRVFGNALIEPYHVNRATYAVAPHFFWQPPHPVPAYRYAVMRDFYTGWEMDGYRRLQTVRGFLGETVLKLTRALLFYLGIALLPVLLVVGKLFSDRRVRYLVVSVGVLAAGMLLETWMIPHYLSPFTAIFYGLIVYSLQLLWTWMPGGRAVGSAIVRNTVVACVLLAALRTWAAPLHLRTAEWPTWYWFGSPDFGAERARVQDQLAHQPGKQLAIVRYSGSHNSIDEWVYNAADIDGSAVIWAREMGNGQDRELLDYYKGRTAWLVEPDTWPARVSHYVPLPVTGSQPFIGESGGSR